jgi:hypothetical protein
MYLLMPYIELRVERYIYIYIYIYIMSHTRLVIWLIERGFRIGYWIYSRPDYIHNTLLSLGAVSSTACTNNAFAVAWIPRGPCRPALLRASTSPTSAALSIDQFCSGLQAGLWNSPSATSKRLLIPTPWYAIIGSLPQQRRLTSVISRRIPSSGMLRRVNLVRTDVPEELSASFIRVTRIGELGTKLQLALFLVHQFLSSWWKRR